MRIRLLQTGYNTAFMNMGIDEVVLGLVQDQKSLPALRFYGWKPAAISVGYFQSLESEVNLAECQKRGVDFLRRITGGGAVFHSAEVTYSLISQIDGDFIPFDILESYQKICRGIIEGLKAFKIEASFAPLNDIIVGNQKISGNAQTRKKGVLLQHGTILLNVDVETMFSLLKVSDEKIKDKLIKNVKERVTSISCLCGREVSYEEVETALVVGFQSALHLEYIREPLRDFEINKAEELAKEKYQRAEWNKKR